MRAAPKPASTRVRTETISSRANVVKREPPRHARGRRHREQPADHEDAIGDGIENLADVGDLVPTSRHEAVNPVGRAERRQQPRRDGAVIGAEQEPEEERQQRQVGWR